MNSRIRLILSFLLDEHQRFFRSLCISLKVPHTIKLAKSSLTDGKAVVIGLQSTGESAAEYEASQLTKDDSKMHDFISSPAAGLKRLIYKLFPLPFSSSSFLNGIVKAKQPLNKRKAAVLAKQRISRGVISDDDLDDDIDSDSDLRSFIASDDTDDDLFGEEDTDYRDNSKKNKITHFQTTEDMVEGKIEMLLFDDKMIVDLTKDSDTESIVEEKMSFEILSDDESKMGGTVTNKKTK